MKLDLSGFTGTDADILSTPEQIQEFAESVREATEEKFKAYDQAHMEALIKAKQIVLD